MDEVSRRRREWAQALRQGHTRGPVAIAVELRADVVPADVTRALQVRLDRWLEQSPVRDFPPPADAEEPTHIALCDAVSGFTTTIDGSRVRVVASAVFTARGWKDWLVEDVRAQILGEPGVVGARVVWPWEEVA